MKINFKNEDGTSDVMPIHDAMQHLHERITSCEGVLLVHQLERENAEQVEPDYEAMRIADEKENEERWTKQEAKTK